MSDNDQVFPGIFDSLRSEVSENLADRLFHQLSEMILNGELPAGYVFPNENVFCAQLAVGRSTLREVYKALSSFGFITRSKTGTIVNDRDKIISATPLNVTLDRSSLKDLLEFRLMLESETAQLAAHRATKADIDRLTALFDKSLEIYEKHDFDEMLKQDIRFHLAIADASHNRLLRDTMTSVIPTWERAVGHNFMEAMRKKQDILMKTALQHKELVSAIKYKDGEAARELMREHIVFVSK